MPPPENKAAVKPAEKVHNPFELKEGEGKVYRLDHGTLKHRKPAQELPGGLFKAGAPVYIDEGSLVLLDPAWVKTADPHGHRFIDPKKAWTPPSQRRDAKAEELVRYNEELKKQNADLMKQLEEKAE